MITHILFSEGSFLQIIAFVIAYFSAVFIALGMHEFSHAYVAYKCGDPTAKLSGRMTLNPFAHIDGYGLLAFLFIGFGWAKPVPINPTKFRNYKKGMFLVSISGVTINIILSFIFSLFAFLMYPHSDGNLFFSFVYTFFYFSMIINLALAVFNLLPIYPLDGFNTISTFLKYDNKFVQFMRKYGPIVMLIIIISGLFNIVFSFVVNNVTNAFWSLWKIIFGGV